MPTPYVAALLLGVVAGLRTFTAPAALSLWRHFGPLGYALGALAVLEYVGDLHPRTPPRTGTLGLLARCASGAFCGWGVTTAHDASAATGVALGVAGALIGAYGGLAF